ncbi:MAG: hypothetical protein J6U04_08135 [Salinivirgaceae bacterium]|nr:hypothetical protein [Salinivirgaceae bacterium]
MAKEILYVDLNYIHHALSPKTRIATLALGVCTLGVGVWSIVQNGGNIAALASGIVNAAIGTTAFLFSMRHLPSFAKKFIRLSESSVKIKNHWFIPRHKFPWEDIEKIEITRENIKITTDYSSKTKVYDIMGVSYDDFNVLHKQIVDNCLERNIDMI